jgi:hypothetical protein
MTGFYLKPPADNSNRSPITTNRLFLYSTYLRDTVPPHYFLPELGTQSRLGMSPRSPRGVKRCERRYCPMTLHHLLALEMAFLLAGNSEAGRPAVLGVVVQAHCAHVNTAAVSDGATVYDGDQFSTEAGGALRLRGEGAALDLAEESELHVRSARDGAQEIEAELIKGTLLFSGAHPAAVEIVAREARIGPAGEARTIGQVSVIGPKEVRIYARRGPLQFSYRGESETVAEGQSYRVILDPPEDDPKNKKTIKATRHRKKFLLLAIGGGAGGAEVVAYEMRHHHKPPESPDRP